MSDTAFESRRRLHHWRLRHWYWQRNRYNIQLFCYVGLVLTGLVVGLVSTGPLHRYTNQPAGHLPWWLRVGVSIAVGTIVAELTIDPIANRYNEYLRRCIGIRSSQLPR